MNTYNKPEITEEKIEFIRELIAENPDMGRTKISVALCEMWNWRGANGKVKDMACRDMLRALDKGGKIQLPPPQTRPRKTGVKPVIAHLVHEDTPVVGVSKDFQPLQVEIVSSTKDLKEFKSAIDQYHYLGFDRFIGERMAYKVCSRDGVALAFLLFGSAAWSCKDRDEHIGWNKEARSQKLNLLTNNTRFLILPWVRIPHLASHILSLVSRRIKKDWEEKYGHPVLLLETFVETERFKGTCYKAANWIQVGQTTGRGRDGGHHQAVLPVKDVYLYSLVKKFKSVLVE